MVALLIAVICLGIWLYLLLGRGGFWRVREQPSLPLRRTGLSVSIVMPARDEAANIGNAVTSLLSQSYPGRIELCVVDDHSTDGTADVARRAAQAVEAADKLTIVEADPLPPGWTGKLWALSCGVKSLSAWPDYLLFTDADIVHAPDNVAGLVARAESDGLDLVSLMVKLRCDSFAERALIPAFLFFFLKLYPPSWIADLEAKTAGAAGGCILIRPSALRRIGGIEQIRSELIDDCALAREVKRGGPIWMGLTSRTVSTRAYQTAGEIFQMISRTAFTQLRHSVLMLAGTVIGLTLTYLAPVVLVIAGPNLEVHVLGASAWLLMSVAYWPTLRFYGRSPLWAPFLPAVALFYLCATVYSAIGYWTGRGGLWKGRVQDAW